MYEIWQVEPSTWLVDHNGQHIGPARVRIVSRHRTARCALRTLNQPHYGRRACYRNDEHQPTRWIDGTLTFEERV